MLETIVSAVQTITGQAPLPSLLLAAVLCVVVVTLRSQKAVEAVVHGWDVSFTTHRSVTDVRLKHLENTAADQEDCLRDVRRRLAENVCLAKPGARHDVTA